MSKLALKRLTASDLTLFEWHFRHLNAGNQKAINLNADVFVGSLFPTLRQHAADPLPIDLYLYGPGNKPELNLRRKIIKGGTYKNWRLNGEYISNPLGDDRRFDLLREGDLVILEFNDDPLPVQCRCVFIALADAADAPLHRELSALVQSRSMVVLERDTLEQALRASATSEDHPSRTLGLDAALEDAVQGGMEGTRELRRRGANRRVLRTELLSARRRADENGLRGEELVNAHLERLLERGEISDFVWESLENAVAPFDFTIIHGDGAPVEQVDVKSTAGDFARPLHISAAELYEMKERAKYSIFRIYDLSDEGGHLRIASDIQGFADGIVAQLATLPTGVSADSISVRPEILPFGDAIRLDFE
jgi:hypothetical protein